MSRLSSTSGKWARTSARVAMPSAGSAGARPRNGTTSGVAPWPATTRRASHGLSGTGGEPNGADGCGRYRPAMVPLSREAIRRAPKVVLHDHLDGGLRPRTVIELAAEHGYAGLPTTDEDDLAAWFR